MKKECEKILNNKGYKHSELFGWEKPETLARFGLHHSMEEIPSCEIEEYDYRQKRQTKKGDFDLSVGEYQVITERTATGKKKTGIAPNFLEYIRFRNSIRKPVEEIKFTPDLSSIPF